ncbi:MAG TPA: 4-hydroxy-3-methylbut-2-enyl diphosphate reductase [Pseudonocardiaceae bacterium]|nr:4-hydroxy-3-methylbut-2-enyl diphosphate reductase [Pseudonocardiaceae bacterium]
MCHPHPPALVAARAPTRLVPGTVLVADELHGADRVVLGCPAAALLTAELRRRGLATTHGPLHLIDTIEESAHAATGAAVVVPAAGGWVGLGVATAGGTDWHTARSVLADWASVLGDRSVLLAAPRSFCAGVDRAIEIVERALEQRDGPVYVRKQIVHNAHVVAALSARGAMFVDELEAVPAGATVVFSAHGVSPVVREEASRRELEVIDATCPLVTKVHTEARRFAARGDTVILVGHREHEEIEGVLGEAPARTTVVATVADVEALQVDDPERVSYLTQTTLGVEETAEVIADLHTRFPALRGPASADICYATTNRQNALSAIAEDCDLVLVVGSENSSNSQRLVELARLRGAPGYLIDAPGDIRPSWLAGVRVLGLTAGASAPTHLVDDVVTALGGLGGLTVTEREVAREDISFTLPSALRSPARLSSRGEG